MQQPVQKSMPRWLKFLIALVLGISAGVLYGWVLSPVQYVDIAPESLAASHQADYTLMTAQIYHADHDLDAASARLSVFGGVTPAGIAEQALEYGQQNGFRAEDILLLQELNSDLRTWQSAGGAP